MKSHENFLSVLAFHLFAENSLSAGTIYTLYYVSDGVSFNGRKGITTPWWLQFFGNITSNDKCHNLLESLRVILPLSLLIIF